jgi:hypothetical protein
MSLATVTPLASSTAPPALAMEIGPVPAALLWASLRLPVTAVPPVYALLPERVSVPAPVLVSAPLPVMRPE